MTAETGTDADARAAGLGSRVSSLKPRVLRPETQGPGPEARVTCTDADTDTDAKLARALARPPHGHEH
ncbi:MAG: hypothetical protein JRJ80_08535 [Deltaproteobacteria bacterium]|nr:hypothetical protein [Deltaproteobacteria bacterium]